MADFSILIFAKWKREQTISQRWQPLHFFGSILIIIIQFYQDFTPTLTLARGRGYYVDILNKISLSPGGRGCG